MRTGGRVAAGEDGGIGGVAAVAAAQGQPVVVRGAVQKGRLRAGAVDRRESDRPPLIQHLHATSAPVLHKLSPGPTYDIVTSILERLSHVLERLIVRS